MLRNDAPSFHLGWQLIDPGPPPRTQSLEHIPTSDDPTELLRLHEAWRMQCEQEDQVLADQHTRSATVWFPVQRAKGFRVVPFFGGTPATWQAAVATLTQSLVRNGYSMIRIADLSRVGALDLLKDLMRAHNPGWSALNTVVSPSGSSIDLFALPSAELLAATVVDVLRETADQQGLLDANSTKEVLLDLAALLDDDTPTLDRLADVCNLVLTGRPPSAGSFSSAERSRIQYFHQMEVRQRASLSTLLDNLERALGSLGRFGPATGNRAEIIGSGELRVRSFGLADTGTTTDLEMGRRLLSRFVARQYSRNPAPRPEALILVGADHLSPDVLQRLVDSAQLGPRQLLLLFERISGLGERVLGSWGSTHAIFFRLGNEEDRRFASGFLGSSYRFVVSGYSLNVTETTAWNESRTFGSDRSLSLTKDFGTRLGGSLSLAISKSRGVTETTGGSTSSATTKNVTRVNEPILEPEIFRDIPDTTMLIVSRDQVVIADCNPRIRALPITSPTPVSGMNLP